jgi:hypothetical protein
MSDITHDAESGNCPSEQRALAAVLVREVEFAAEQLGRAES